MRDKFIFTFSCVEFHEWMELVDTKMTIFLCWKSWNTNIVSYRPASFIHMLVPWRCKPIINIEGTCLLMNLLKKIFPNVVSLPNFKILFEVTKGFNEITVFEIHYTKCLLLKNGQSPYCIDILSPHNTRVAWVRVKYCKVGIS